MGDDDHRESPQHLHRADEYTHAAGGGALSSTISAYREVQTRMITIGLNFMTLTIFINEDSLATVERQLDALERLIARHGAHAFFGEPDAEPPRQTA